MEQVPGGIRGIWIIITLKTPLDAMICGIERIKLNSV